MERETAEKQPDYWDHATLLEIAILEKDEAAARNALGEALACVREKWEPETTLRNLRLVGEARAQRGAQMLWAGEIEKALERGAGFDVTGGVNPCHFG